MKSNKSFLNVILLIVFICTGIALGKIFHIDVNSVQAWMSHVPQGLLPVAYVVIYVITTFVIWFSKDVLRIVAAVMFGPYISTVLVSIAEILNAAVLFSFSRLLGREYIQNKFSISDQHIARTQVYSGFFGVMILRAPPLIPLRFLDLAYGLTKISLSRYVLATTIITPFRLLWQMFALAGIGEAALTDPKQLFDYYGQHPLLMKYSVVYISVTIVAFLISFFIWKHKYVKALENET